MKQMAVRTKFMAIVGAVLVAVLALSGVAWAATALAVTKTVPSSSATGVARTVNVKAYFNHDMKASTITSSTFKVKKEGTTNWLSATRSVNNTISPTSTNGGSQSVATLNPDADLALNTTYRVVVVGGRSGVKDVNGNTLSANESWTFTTVAPPETTINSGPEGTVASTSATFTFSSSKAGSTFKCSLDNSANSAFAGCISPKSYSGLSQGPHTFWVKAIDASGNTDPTPASRSWTVDTTAPSVVGVTPADAATGVARGTNITATFSEVMNFSTISDQTFTLSKSGSPVSAQVTYDANSQTATLNPDLDLEAGATYDVKITTSVSDAAGNSLVQEKTWSFTTVSGVTVTPNPLTISTALCIPWDANLSVTNYGPGDVTIADVSITGPDAAYFSESSVPFTVAEGHVFVDTVTLYPSQTSRTYSATLTYKDATGATIGNPVDLIGKTQCLVFP